MTILHLRVLALFGLALGGYFEAQAQATRVADSNALGWYVYEGNHKLGPRWTVHTEYQWRRVDFVRDWQQSLARLGAGYQILPRLKLGGGYTSLVTHVFGRYPTAETGVPFPEHRLYEDVTLSDTVDRVTLQHRVRLEQRWQGQLNAGAPRGDIASWQYLNRIRYQLGALLPLQGRRLDSHEWYLTAFDELFIAFGRNVRSVFNQNRIAGGVGYQVSDNFQLELQYLNQITQHDAPDPATNLPVVEFNHGFRLGVTYDLTLIK